MPGGRPTVVLVGYQPSPTAPPTNPQCLHRAIAQFHGVVHKQNDTRVVPGRTLTRAPRTTREKR